jgi:hypothetical protein
MIRFLFTTIWLITTYKSCGLCSNYRGKGGDGIDTKEKEMGRGEGKANRQKSIKNKIKQHSPDPQMFSSGKRGHLRRVEITYTLVTHYTVVKDIITQLCEFPLTKG